MRKPQNKRKRLKRQRKHRAMAKPVPQQPTAAAIGVLAELAAVPKRVFSAALQELTTEV
jgi:hypothetical protein